MDAAIDKEAAAVLNQIPAEGATVPLLAGSTKMAAERVEAAVGRLHSLRLIERDGPTVRLTPFAQKARNMFSIVG